MVQLVSVLSAVPRDLMNVLVAARRDQKHRIAIINRVFRREQWPK